MKILLTGDKHIRYNAPENRNDDFFEVQFEKEQQMLEIAVQNHCKAILQPGDFFDNPHPPKYALSRYISLYRQVGIPIYTVLGQHDTVMRNLDAAVSKTATYLLQAADVVHIAGLDRLPVMLDANTALYGVSFDQEYLPVPPHDGFNILMAHASVGDKPLYPGHVLTGPREYARKHQGFDLILLGDYHYPYEDKWQACDVINCGVTVRKTVDVRELELKPRCCVYDTETHTYVMHCLRIKPWNEVFTVPEKTQDTSRLDEFIDSVRSSGSVELSFTSNLRALYATQVVKPAVKDRIAEAMSKVDMPKEELL